MPRKNNRTIACCWPALLRLTLLLVLGLGFCVRTNASHIRAGEMTATRLGGASSLRFRFTLTVYTDNTSNVVNQSATISFGDGASATVQRNGAAVAIPGTETNINQYIAEHTYPAPGAYTAYYYELNRNFAVINMGNSGSTNFYVETRILIDPLLGANSTPLLLNPPIDQGVIGQVYRHNPSAYDPDGDSLSFELTPSRQFVAGTGSVQVGGWQYPEVAAGGQDSAQTGPARLTINARTGQLTWDVPRNTVGEYNIAFKVIEWRRNRFGRMVQLGYVVRDMQILIKDSRNTAPRLKVPAAVCRVAGSAINGLISATDDDVVTTLEISATGGPISVSGPPSIPATLTRLLQIPQQSNSQFSWQTNCNDVRAEPYLITFKASENSSFTPKLVDIKPWLITIYGPRPTGLKAFAQSDAVTLNWDNYSLRQCSQADSIIIYRKIDSTATDTTGCTPGMPIRSGYTRIAAVPAAQTQYFDDNRGAGLRQGVFYSYRLVARYPAPKGGLSYPSDQVKVRMKLTKPNILRASVLRTDATKGMVSLVWTKPLEPDTLTYKPPYGYQLERSSANTNGTFVTVYQTQNWLQDTTFIDSLVNTKDQQVNYRLKLDYFAQTTTGLVRRSIDAGAASTPFLTGVGGPKQVQLVWNATTPWQNRGSAPLDLNGQAQAFHHLIFREVNDTYLPIDSVILSGTQGTYTDRGTYQSIPLVNGRTYNYYVITRGSYSTPPLPVNLVNLSQLAPATPIDTTPPPPPGDTTGICNPRGLPNLIVQGCTTCEALTEPSKRLNVLTWTFDSLTNPCDSGLAAYNVYFNPNSSGRFSKIATLDPGQLQFVHNNAGSMAGCYYLTSTTRFGIESNPSATFCTDNCPFFELPNVITPGVKDGLNDLFRPKCSIPEFVADLDAKVYNRYGVEVFSTNDPEVNWPGTNRLEGGTPVPAGVYFYRLVVRFKRLDANAPAEIYKGWIEVMN